MTDRPTMEIARGISPVAIFRDVRTEPGGPQVGIYMIALSPGNCIDRVPFAAVWYGVVIDLAGDEANDNLRLGIVH